MICVDLIIDDIFDSLKNIGVSYFFSPVYTTSIDTMSDYASIRFKNHGAITFASNCCHALTHSKSLKNEPSFFIDVGKRKTDDVIIKTKNCFTSIDDRKCDYKICYDHVLIKDKKVDSHTPVGVKW